MPITLPATDPVTDYYRPLSHGRVVILENSSLPWAVTLTRRYARKKRIPEANIVSVALGTGTTHDPTSNALLVSTLYHPLRVAMDACGAQAVLTGPGCPASVTWRNKIFDGLPNATGNVDLVTSVANAREIDQRATEGRVLGWVQSGSAGAAAAYVNVLTAWYAFATTSNCWPEYALGQGAGPPVPYPGPAGTPPDPLYNTTHEGPNAESMYLPTQLAIDRLGDANNRAVVSGRIGYYWGAEAYVQTNLPVGGDPAPAREDSQSAGAVMEAGLRYGAGLNPANRYQQRVHLQLGPAHGSLYSLIYLGQQMQNWGYDLTYAYRSGALGLANSYLPASGGAYTQAQLDRGEIKDEPYHVMLGDGTNLEMMHEPYTSAWQPSGGGGVLMGPSEGWQYGINGLQRGGAAGVTHRLHIGGDVYTGQYSLLRGLLRGMCWGEALYYCINLYINMPAMADPLLRPFPR